MLAFDKILRKYRLTYSDFADFFDFKSRLAFYNSSGLPTYKRAVEVACHEFAKTADEHSATRAVFQVTKGQTWTVEAKILTGIPRFIKKVQERERDGKVRDPETGLKIKY